MSNEVFSPVESMPPIQQQQQDYLFGGSNDIAKMLEKLIEDDQIKEKFKDSPLWAIVSKSFILTFLNEVDAEILRHRFAEALISFRNSFPEYEWTNERRLALYNIKMIFEANINRARGTSEGRVNERILISSQIKHTTSVIAEDNARRSGLGIVGKIGRMFGR